MDQSSDASGIQTSKTPSARALLALKAEILQEWELEIRRKIGAATGLEHPIIINTLPSFLDNLAESLAEEHPRRLATEATNIGQEHGGERARLSRYSPEQLILEYQILRDVLSRKLEAAAALTPKDRDTIQLSIDRAVCEAMTAFFLVHNRIREQFVASLTHDLRNPLAAAKMSAELLLLALNDAGAAEDPDDLKGLAQRIIGNTKRADRMIQDLLDTTVIHMGDRIPLKISECEMLSIVKDVIADVRRDEVTRIKLQGMACWGFWDPDAIRRAIENLLANALKYGKADAPVTIRITSEGERIMVSVHNEGESIPLHEQEMLFQAFRRAEAAKAGDKKGWGIGLALVRGVAEGHGGSIGLDSLPGRGTTFMIDIPVDARPFQQAATSAGT